MEELGFWDHYYTLSAKPVSQAVEGPQVPAAG